MNELDEWSPDIALSYWSDHFRVLKNKNGQKHETRNFLCKK